MTELENVLVWRSQGRVSRHALCLPACTFSSSDVTTHLTFACLDSIGVDCSDPVLASEHINSSLKNSKHVTYKTKVCGVVPAPDIHGNRGRCDRLLCTSDKRPTKGKKLPLYRYYRTVHICHIPATAVIRAEYNELCDASIGNGCFDCNCDNTCTEKDARCEKDTRQKTAASNTVLRVSKMP